MAVLGFNSNVTSLNATRHLDRATKRVQSGYERLATGMRINRASDDAAGLAIADTLKANSRLYKGASRNISDAISTLGIVDSTLSEQSSVMQRLIELSEQASNGTLSSTQRSALNKEYQALIDEFGRLADATSFNGLKLLNGVRGGLTSLNFQTGITGQASARLTMNTADTGSFSGYVQYGYIVPALTALVPHANYTSTESLLSFFGNAVAFTTVKDANGQQHDIAVSFLYETTGAISSMRVFERSEDVGPAGYLIDGDDPVGPAGGWTEMGSALIGVDSTTGAINVSGPTSVALSFNSQTVAATFTIDLRGLRFITGSTTQQTVTAIDFAGVETSARASAALTSGKARLAELGAIRGDFGALLSRLETAQNVTEVSGENTAAAESRIRDADVAEESAGLLAAQIVQNAGASILSQANQQPELLLFLLTGGR